MGCVFLRCFARGREKPPLLGVWAVETYVQVQGCQTDPTLDPLVRENGPGCSLEIEALAPRAAPGSDQTSFGLDRNMLMKLFPKAGSIIKMNEHYVDS